MGQEDYVSRYKQDESSAASYIFFSQKADCTKDTVHHPAALLFRKLSNPDLFSSTGKVKLHRQLSQDDCKLRRGSLTGTIAGKQLLPLSSSVHSGVGQPTWQPPGESSNLVRMRNQSLGQSAPSLTAGLCSSSMQTAC
ncbi:PREDICTED: microtubule-associated serine/threonine-protein kinase 2-like [Nanorana parkeri]|uniref:microtubule-associated serine/threonine-protein kinase 2-like n=1 Tax=Nanorana parkeri TaxID=125878 RepID=UPI00085407F0|nr:PREDICTED: microtubule-associated serine/threonine-protein kinase 2-like [Nanorana parkeri]